MALARLADGRVISRARRRPDPAQVSGGPGPLEVEAAAVAVDVQDLAGEEEPGGEPRLERFGEHVRDVDAAGGDLRVGPGVGPRDLETPALEHRGDGEDVRLAERGGGPGRVGDAGDLEDGGDQALVQETDQREFGARLRASAPGNARRRSAARSSAANSGQRSSCTRVPSPRCARSPARRLRSRIGGPERPVSVKRISPAAALLRVVKDARAAGAFPPLRHERGHTLDLDALEVLQKRRGHADPRQGGEGRDQPMAERPHQLVAAAVRAELGRCPAAAGEHHGAAAERSPRAWRPPTRRAAAPGA